MNTTLHYRGRLDWPTAQQDRRFCSLPASLAKSFGVSTCTDLLGRLEKSTIRHKRFHATNGAPTAQQIKEGQQYMQSFFPSFRTWAHKAFGIALNAPCPVRVENHPTASFAGLFVSSNAGEHHIIIQQYLLSSPFYLSIVLAHEYVHYLHWRHNEKQRHLFYQSPMVLCEGLAEHGAQRYLKDTGIILPVGMEKSWNVAYELGRQIVVQLSEKEGFGLDGTLRLSSSPVNKAWSQLDSIFHTNT